MSEYDDEGLRSDRLMMGALYHDITMETGERVVGLNHCLLGYIDRKWPGKHMYCSKHKVGPLDSWYDCSECYQKVSDEHESHKRSEEYAEGQRRFSGGAFSEGLNMMVCPSRRKLLRHYKMPTILKKVPRDAAEAWIAKFYQGSHVQE